MSTMFMSIALYLLIYSFHAVAQFEGGEDSINTTSSFTQHTPNCDEEPCSEGCLPPIPNTLDCQRCESLGCGTSFDPYFNSYCACDEQCIYYGDCCSDFKDICPVEYNNATHMQETFKDLTKPTCFPLPYAAPINTVYIVNTCPNGSFCDYVEDGSDPERFPLPVTDKDTRLHYTTVACATCNNVSRFDSWSVSIECAVNFTPEKLSTLKDVVSFSKENDCPIAISVPFEGRICSYVIDSCNASCDNSLLVSMCHDGPVQYVYNYYTGENYKNYHCAMCNNRHKEADCGLNLNAEYTPPWQTGDGALLTVLFDFQATGSKVQPNIDATLHCIGEYILKNNICVLPNCKLGTFNYNMCQANLIFDETVRISFETLDTAPFLITEEFISNLESHLLPEGLNYWYNYEDRLMNTIECPTLQSTPIVDRVSWNIICYLTFQVHSFVYWENEEIEMKKANSFYEALFQTSKSIAKQELLRYIYANFDPMMLKIKFLPKESSASEITMPPDTVDPSYDASSRNDTKEQTLCAMLILPEYTLVNDSLQSPLLLVDVPPDQYHIENGTAYICKDFFDKYHDESSYESVPDSVAMAVTSQIILYLSIAALLLRVALQPFVPVFWTFPNKLQFCLSATMCMAFIIFVISPYMKDIFSVCVTFALLVHWSFLSVFFWMFAISLNMYRTFRPSQLNRSMSSQGKHLLRYMTLGWLPGLFIVLLSFSFDYFPIDQKYQPLYGVYSCWFGGKIAHIVFFGVPLIIIILTNIGLFIATSISLHRAFDASNSVNQRSALYKVKLNVQLAILVGSTWLIAFIASAVRNEVLWYIFIILCGLQGVFIVVSFVFTKQVWQSLRDRKKSTSSGTSGVKTQRTYVQSSKQASPTKYNKVQSP